MTKRYIPVKNHKGIRKEANNGKFQVRKKIKGKTYTETFHRVSDAMKWRDSFHPDFSKSISNQIVEDKSSRPFLHEETLNGKDVRFTFKEVWEMYCVQYLPSIQPRSAVEVVKRGRVFFLPILDIKVSKITSEVIDKLVVVSVENHLKSHNRKKSIRMSFDLELKTLKAVLNWYRENYDAMFIVPVVKRHYIAGRIKQKSLKKKRKMSIAQTMSFFDCIDELFWKDFAKFHFYMAGRVQEPAGMQWENIDFKKSLLVVSDVAIWGESKKFTYLKEVPKNGHERIVHLNEEMLDILERRKSFSKECPSHCRMGTKEALDFVFHIDGEPLGYRQIQHRYNKALRKADLYPEFKSTHILRKAMANIVRQSMGLDAAQAVGGWRTRDIVDKVYTDNMPAELNRSAVNNVQKILMEYEKEN